MNKIERAYGDYARAWLPQDDVTLDAIELLEDGVSVSQVARDLGMPEPHLRSRARYVPKLSALIAESDAQREAAQQAEKEAREAADTHALLNAVEQGIGAATAAQELGRTYYWVQNKARRDPAFERALSNARQKASERPTRPPTTTAPDPEPKQSRLSSTVAADRAALAKLYPLMERGVVLDEALRSIGRTASWLSRARDRVPEAGDRLRQAARAGTRNRPQRPRGKNPALLERDAMARRLVLAALAGGVNLQPAAKAGGADARWVTREYHRNGEFRRAVDALAALRPDYDIVADLERFEPGGFIPAPRPPRNAADNE